MLTHHIQSSVPMSPLKDLHMIVSGSTSTRKWTKRVATMSTFPTTPFAYSFPIVAVLLFPYFPAYMRMSHIIRMIVDNAQMDLLTWSQ